MIIVLTKVQIEKVKAVTCTYCGAEAETKCKPIRCYYTWGCVIQYRWNNSHEARFVAAGIQPKTAAHRHRTC